MADSLGNFNTQIDPKNVDTLTIFDLLASMDEKSHPAIVEALFNQIKVSQKDLSWVQLAQKIIPGLNLTNIPTDIQEILDANNIAYSNTDTVPQEEIDAEA